MLLVALSLLAVAGDRTTCEKKYFTIAPDSGVNAIFRPDCKREKGAVGDGYKAGNCITSEARLTVPDPYDPEKVVLRVTQPTSLAKLNPDAGKDRTLTLHDATVTPEAVVYVLGGDGERVLLPVRGHAQVKGAVESTILSWDIPVSLPEERLRHLRAVGLDGWSFQVNGQTFTHYVKKNMYFEGGVDCVLDGVIPGAKR